MLERTVYLASCSLGAMSDALTAALTEFQSTMFEHGSPWERWTSRVDEARRHFAALIQADVDDVAVVSSASEGAYQVASGFRWKRAEAVVTTELEFPSIAHVWLAQRANGATVRYAETEGGFATAEGYEKAMDGPARLVSVPLVSYRHGQRLPVERIAELARDRGAQVFVDAYQGLGVEPVDVRKLGCDYLVSGTHKYLLGLPGLAFLYVRRGVNRELDPQLTGWFGRVDPFAFNPRELDFPSTARRYEVGTPPVVAAYGAVAGLKLLATLDAGVVRAHVRGLTSHLRAGLAGIGERLASPASEDDCGPMVAVHDPAPDRLARFLAARKIVTSPRSGLLRIAVHYYNNDADVEAVVEAIHEYRSGR
ncbi:aminotransferase class V-fold PLP-dependent enzyme [Nonomuraea sp. NPDC049152]|uniref:aminotransferase class V-fold PLP-dependent enzyme n=1 Tax=Nonomuraea sp. NPDC049152 TaxID=3154350 RepID=UPI003408F284